MRLLARVRRWRLQQLRVKAPLRVVSSESEAQWLRQRYQQLPWGMVVLLGITVGFLVFNPAGSLTVTISGLTVVALILGYHTERSKKLRKRVLAAFLVETETFEEICDTLKEIRRISTSPSLRKDPLTQSILESSEKLHEALFWSLRDNVNEREEGASPRRAEETFREWSSQSLKLYEARQILEELRDEKEAFGRMGSSIQNHEAEKLTNNLDMLLEEAKGQAALLKVGRSELERHLKEHQTPQGPHRAI